MSSRIHSFVAASLVLAAFPSGAAAQVPETKLPAAPIAPRASEPPLVAPHKPSAAQAAAKQGLPQRLARLGAHPAIESVLHDREADGSELARGADWKARFGSTGASFVPFLGSQAPASHPLQLHLDSIEVGGSALALPESAEVGRDGELVTLAHGDVLERYELGLHGLEQSFVIPALPVRGELVLRLGFETDLAARIAGDGAESPAISGACATAAPPRSTPAAARRAPRSSSTAPRW